MYVKISDIDKERYAKKREAIKNTVKANRESNQEKIKQRKQEDYKNNRERYIEKTKVYRKSLAGNETLKLARAKRKAQDPLFTSRCSLRSRFTSAIRGKYRKQTSALDLIGCTVPEFREHVEKQWTEGMTWDNYGVGTDDRCFIKVFLIVITTRNASPQF